MVLDTSPYQIDDLQIFSFIQVAFPFLDDVLSRKQVLNYGEIQCAYSFFCSVCFLMYIKLCLTTQDLFLILLAVL